MHAAVVSDSNVIVDARVLRRYVPRDERRHAGAVVQRPVAAEGRAWPFDAASPSVCQTPRRTMHGVSCSTPTLRPAPAMARKDENDEDGAEYGYNEEAEEEWYYECEAIERPLAQRVFHYMDVLPFGLRRPSDVFATVGRHTSRGLVLGVTESGLFRIRPYDTPDEQPLRVAKALRPWCSASSVRPSSVRYGNDLRSAVPDASPRYYQADEAFVAAVARCCGEDTVQTELRDFFAAARGEGGGVGRQQAALHESHARSVLSAAEQVSGRDGSAKVRCTEVLCELRDLALPPVLAVHAPVPPLRVGARVLARRFGCNSTLQLACVRAVYYDVSYVLEYESDHGVDIGVLHNDIHLLADGEAAQAEVCTVRDRVIVTLQRQESAVVVQALGQRQYRVVLTRDPDHDLVVGAPLIAHVASSLRAALYAEPTIVEWFRTLDPAGRGVVRWKDVRQVILGGESFSSPLSFQRVGELQRELCLRLGRVEPQLLRKVPMQEEEMLLNYAAFEYVLLRARNLL